MNRLGALFAIFCVGAVAHAASGSWTLTGTGSTSAVSGIDALSGKAATIHTLTVATTGSNTVCTIRLEGSLNGSHFWDLSGSQDCAVSDTGSGKGTAFHVAEKPVRFVRATIVTWTGGTSAAIYYLGSN